MSQCAILASLLAAITPMVDATTYSLRVPTLSSFSDANITAVDPSYPGYAFEQASFYAFAFDDTGNANDFSQNLISSVLNRTGGTPVLRVGGTSGDRASYVASQSDAVNYPATQWPPRTGDSNFLSVGPSYFEAYKNFPGAKFIFMVPLENVNLSNTIEWTRAGLAEIGDSLQALEIGNEPDFYSWYSVSKYTDEFLRFQKALTAEFPSQLDHLPVYQALDAAWSANTTSVADAIASGINSTKSISQIAYHYYQDSDRSDEGLPWLQSDIANHTAIIRAMSRFAPNIQWLRENAPNVPFVLSENGNTLGNGNIEQRNNLATALWNVDYQLYGMTIGVDRVNNQQIVCPGYQMWVPQQTVWGPPLVRANFYSQPFVADFIGNATTVSGGANHTYVSALRIDSSDLLSAYVAYDNAEIARFAVINFELWTSGNATSCTTTSTSTSTPTITARPCATITFTDLPSNVTNASIYSLTAPEGALANDTLTYRGLQWTYESKGLPVPVGRGNSTLAVQNGKVQVCVDAASAVMIELERTTSSATSLTCALVSIWRQVLLATAISIWLNR